MALCSLEPEKKIEILHIVNKTTAVRVKPFTLSMEPREGLCYARTSEKGGPFARQRQQKERSLVSVHCPRATVE